MQLKPLIVFIMGPTASGKTDLALALGQHIACEIISVDSSLVYRGMDIGSAKPSATELASIPHHLIDIRDPADPYSAAEFRDDALHLIDSIIAKGKTPLLVGGTMMYFNVLLKGLADMPASDPDLRAQIEQQASELGWPAMHQRLEKIDPELAATLHPNHSQRIARALEVYQLSGKTMTQLRNEQHVQRQRDPLAEYDVKQIALTPAKRETLHARIALRYQRMLDEGFEAEVLKLYQRDDLHSDLPAIRAVGYRQMWGYLNSEYDYDEMVAKGVAATRQLAKRQLTWLRGWSELKWIFTDNDQGQIKNINQIVKETLSYLQISGI
ncbi:tRNA (adenosine(37)-N6)-dimethylallyltransferase MiaA [Aurantivibrio plasticivorans]